MNSQGTQKIPQSYGVAASGTWEVWWQSGDSAELRPILFFNCINFFIQEVHISQSSRKHWLYAEFANEHLQADSHVWIKC